MYALLRESFSGAGMEHYQENHLQWLDHILGQFDLGLGYLQQYKPSLSENDNLRTKGQYR